jgi:hypothetical protein
MDCELRRGRATAQFAKRRLQSGRVHGAGDFATAVIVSQGVLKLNQRNFEAVNERFAQRDTPPTQAPASSSRAGLTQPLARPAKSDDGYNNHGIANITIAISAAASKAPITAVFISRILSARYDPAGPRA